MVFCLLLLSAISPGIASAQTVAEKHWALAVSAILTERWAGSHELLTMVPRSPENQARAERALSSDWGVQSKSEVMFLVASLESGHTRTKQAWNLVRANAIVRWAVLAGYLSEEEAWLVLPRLSVIIRMHFSSWQEFQWNYVLGRREWDQAPSEMSRYTQWLYRKLLLDPASPWRRAPWKGLSTVAAITIHVRPAGLTCVSLDIRDRAIGLSYQGEISDLLGCEVKMLYEKQAGDDVSIAAECYKKVAPEGSLTEYRLSFERLALRLKALDVSQVHLVVQQYFPGDLSLHPAPDYEYQAGQVRVAASVWDGVPPPRTTIKYRLD